MRKLVSLGVVTIVLCGFEASPALAQFGRITDALNKGAENAKKLNDIKVTEAEERQIGQQVSDKIVETFGVYQDSKVTKYVSLVGTVLAKASSRPGLDWQFVVLDTDGVNAFAAPGGFVHVTRGLLGLLKDEGELAGVLAHELTHVTERHTVNAIQQGGAIKLGSDSIGASGGMTQSLIGQIAEQAFKNVYNNAFSRKDENEADEKGVQLANKLGYAPTGLPSALEKLTERNKDAKEPNGLFASHPVIKDRLANIERVTKANKLGAMAVVQPRYAAHITFDVKPASAIATVAEGSRGLAGGESKPAEKDPKEEPKKEEKKSGGGLLGRLKVGGGSQAQQSQTVASAGARGVNPDRDAVGGANKTRVPVKISPAELAEFQKGIA
jgi:predicted Zn-dependent protease